MELANIRSKFTGARLGEYDRRKYVWKMMYTSMLGYEVDFGLNEVLNLIQFPGFKDKCVGYTAATVLMTAASEPMRAMLRAMRSDIASSDPMLQCLALTSAANFGGGMIAEDLGETVRAAFFGPAVHGSVRKKAALVLLRLFRVKPDVLPVPEYATRLADMLEVPGFGERQAVLTLILGVLAKHGYKPFAAVQAKAAGLVSSSRHVCPSGYAYHRVAAPWYQVRLLRVLKHFPYPTDEVLAHEVKSALTSVMDATTVTKSVNHNNAEHAILFEAINIIIRHGRSAPADLRERAVQQLAKYVNIREPNVRYLGLEAMTRMAALPGTREHVLKNQKAVLISLKERDISLRRRALDLLFATCGKDNAEEIVGELVTHLMTADESIKGEMVLKIAILAERFAPNLRWYVDTVLKLIAHAGDHVSDDIWHRAVQIVTNNAPLQRYAAAKMFRSVEAPTAHETAVRVAAYILGEFGFLLQEVASGEAATGDEDDALTAAGGKQFVALHQHFDRVSPATRVLLLSAYAKLQHLYEEELDHVLTPIFEKHTTVLDEEIQQRAVEYLSLKGQSEELKAAVLEAMPAFAERDSVLEARLKGSGKPAKDVDEWGKGAEGAAAATGGATPVPAAGDAGSISGGEEEDDGAADAFGADEDEDILGLDNRSSEEGASSGPTITGNRGVPDSSKRAVRGALFAFLDRAKTKGRLFADDTAQVAAIAEIRGGLGRVRVHVGNKSAGPLTRLAIDCPGSDAVATKVGDCPDSVAPGSQEVVEVRFKCLRPFADLLPLTVSFLSGPASAATEHTYDLKAPIFATSFLEAVALAPDALRARWEALAAEPKAGSVQLPVAASPKALLEAVGAQVITTAADGAAVGAATFRTETAAADGRKQSVGCIIRVAPREGGTLVQVRTQHPLVTRGVINSIKAALGNGIGTA